MDITKSKFDAHCTGRCLHCGKEDTLAHRALTCPFYGPVQRVHPDCVSNWAVLPPALTHHGIVSENPWQRPWTELHRLASLPVTWHSTPCDESVQNLFTDGSCRHPTNSTLALAGWYIINSNTGKPVGGGLLPSLKQSINRGELWAMIMALRWSRHFACRICIYTDSLYVVRHCQEIQRTRLLRPDLENYDLWQEFFSLWSARPDSVHFEHVSANQSDLLQETEDLADAGAKATLCTLGAGALQDVYQRLCDHHLRQLALAQRYQRFLLALAERGLAWGTRATEPSEPDEEPFHVDISPDALSVQQVGYLAELFPIDWRLAIDADPLLSGCLNWM